MKSKGNLKIDNNLLKRLTYFLKTLANPKFKARQTYENILANEKLQHEGTQQSSGLFSDSGDTCEMLTHFSSVLRFI